MRRLLVVAVAALIAAVPARAQAPVQCKGPLALDQVVRGIRDLPEPRLVQIVRECGVGFALDAGTESVLRAAGAADGVIAAVRAGAPRPSTPAPTPTPPLGRPGDVRTNPGDGLAYVWIPAGTFQMGCVPQDGVCRADETPRHAVTVSRGFWMSRTEATVGAFRRFVAATGHRTDAEREGWGLAWDASLQARLPPGVAQERVEWPRVKGASWRAPGFPQADDHPVVEVSWNDARAYCEWAGGRLPTEAEWEHAARAGGSTVYAWGDEQAPVKEGRKQANVADETARRSYGNFTIFAGYEDGYAATAPVGSFAANGFGLFDVTGNVWEWCADAYDKGFYGRSPVTDPRNDSGGAARARRGGSWFNSPRDQRLSVRDSLAAGHGCSDIGFRCAREVAP